MEIEREKRERTCMISFKMFRLLRLLNLESGDLQVPRLGVILVMRRISNLAGYPSKSVLKPPVIDINGGPVIKLIGYPSKMSEDL